jgi:tRNA-2-methylthio-N6-dimethylallyladenosine synthase
MKIYIETFGCQMNQLDSELVGGQFARRGYEQTAQLDDADVVLINTCSVRDHAEQRVYARLWEEAHRRRAGRQRVVVVIGCMAQRLGRSLREEFPHVDVLCGPGQIHRLAEMVEQARTGQEQTALDPTRKQDRDADAEAAIDRMDLTRSWSGDESSGQAFVRVMRGCDKFCTYCIVPHVRGPERSRRPEDILTETARLLDAGRTEITLLGQTVNSYRHQTGERTVHFSDLIERVAALPGLRRLRFVTSYPTDFGNDILEAMRDLPNVCEYIHCPAQSGADAILRRMGRRYGRAEYEDWVDRARSIVPGVALAGDFIVGFPGETEADHRASADLIRYAGYKNSFVFKYSPRPGTRAARTLKNDVPEPIKKRRNNELLAVQKQVAQAHHASMIGQTVEVLVTGPSRLSGTEIDNSPAGQVQLMGRTRGDHIVVFDGPESLTGCYLDIQLTRAAGLTLFGRPVES